MRIFDSVWLGLVLLASVSVWSQEEERTVPVLAVAGPLSDVSTNDGADRMLTPPPVSGANYPLSFASEERANYLRGGVTFNTAYSDNVLGSTSTNPVSEVSYSVWPTLELDKTL